MDISADYTPKGSPVDGWLWPLLIGAGLFAVLHPFDLPVFEAMSSFGQRMGGDLKREWFAWQQYGQGVAIIVAAVLVWTLDLRQRGRLCDLALAVIVSQLAAHAGKLLIGRPRPRPAFMDPDSFPGPLGQYPIQVDGTWRLVHAWDRSAGASADLWSMPSSHTLFACVLSVFLAHLYPKAAWIFAVLAAMVGLARVVFGAHWPTDVVVGAAAGYAIAAVITRRRLGVRLWVRTVQRGGHTLPARKNRGAA